MNENEKTPPPQPETFTAESGPQKRGGYEPKGTTFYDVASAREVILVSEGPATGWVCYRHPDGQWVTLRKATDDDRAKFAAVENRNLNTMIPGPPLCVGCGKNAMAFFRPKVNKIVRGSFRWQCRCGARFEYGSEREAISDAPRLHARALAGNSPIAPKYACEEYKAPLPDALALAIKERDAALARATKAEAELAEMRRPVGDGEMEDAADAVQALKLAAEQLSKDGHVGMGLNAEAAASLLDTTIRRLHAAVGEKIGSNEYDAKIAKDYGGAVPVFELKPDDICVGSRESGKMRVYRKPTPAEVADAGKGGGK